MIIRLICIGSKMPAWVESGYAEYAKRLPLLHIQEIPAEIRGKNADITRLKEKEGDKILNCLKPGDLNIALELGGACWSTENLSQRLNKWQDENQVINFIIGGPDGLAASVLKASQLHWSLSPLTFPHPLVRIIVAEQLYRAFSILQNHPYHRG